MSPRGRWVVACTAAETIGMAAAASAARLADALPTAGARLTVVVLGGLVEGTALGLLQARVLPAAFAPQARRRWALATVVVAGLGWAAGSAPSVWASAGPADAAAPPWSWVMAGAAALGIAMGLLLGAAQATAAAALHGRRWAARSALGWAAAMPVVFVGATGVGADWSWPALVASGALTGAAAGLVLGVVTGGAVPRLAPRPPGAAARPGATPRPRPTRHLAP